MTGSRQASDERVSRRRLLLVTTAAATLGLGTTAAAERTEQSDGTVDPAWHTLTLDGQGTTSRTVYEFTVSGDLEGHRDLEASDQINGASAVGTTHGGIDTYRFTGDLEEFALDGGDAVLLVDGHPVASADEEWRILTLDGKRTPSRTDYEFAVSGELEARAGIGRDDEIDGSTAEGFVRGGTDTYAFTGELVSYELQRGDGVLFVDGVRVATAKRPWRTLTLDGKGTRSRTDYEFTIAGQLREREGIGQGDEITGKSAEGFVRGGVDGYYFVGTLKEYELRGGDGVLLVDGERVASAGEEDADEDSDDHEGNGTGEKSGKDKDNGKKKGTNGGNGTKKGKDRGEGNKKGQEKSRGKDKGQGKKEGKKKGKDKGNGNGKKKGKNKGKGKKNGPGKDHDEEEDEDDEEDDDDREDDD